MSTPERACNDTPCDGLTTTGSGMVVYQKNDQTCYRRLRRSDDIRSESIPVQDLQNNVQLMDGSAKHPIRLPALQKSNAQAITALAIVTADGTIQKWDPSGTFGKKKIVVIDGSIQIIDDYSSDIFSGSACEGNCTDIDGVLGYKNLTITCPGESDKKAFQLWKLPACCLDEVDDPDNTVPQEVLDAIAEAQADADKANADIAKMLGGIVILRRNGYDTINYIPSANSNSGRFQALRTALIDASSTPAATGVFELVGGVFDIPAGVKLTDFYSQGLIKLKFEQGAALDFANADNALGLHVLFKDRYRTVAWFNAPHGEGPHNQDLKPSCSRHFQACQNSLEPHMFGETDERGVVRRYGEIYIPAGFYHISSPIYVQANQNWHTDDATIYLGDGFAPYVDINSVAKFAFDVSRTVTDHGPDAAFTHFVRIKGFTIIASSIGTEMTGAVNFAGAQNSEICFLSADLLGAGLVFKYGCVGVDVYNNQMNRITGKVGASYDITQGYILTFRNCTAFYHAYYSNIMAADGKFSPGFKLYAANGCTFISCLAEGCNRGVWFDRGNYGNSIVSLRGNVGDSVPANTTLVEFFQSAGNSVNIEGIGYANLIVEEGQVRIIGDPNIAHTAAAYYRQDKTDFSSIKAPKGVYGPLVVESNEFVTFVRPNAPADVRRFTIQSSEADSNAGFIMYFSDTDGSNLTTIMRGTLHTTGGPDAGIQTVFPLNVKVEGFLIAGGMTAYLGELFSGSTKVVGVRNTGWTPMTGAAAKGGGDTTTVTLPQLAAIVKSLQDALTTHGLIGV